MLEIRVRFSAQAHRVLTELADATHVTTIGVMRDALNIYWWLAREHNVGTRFLAVRGQWTLRSYVLWPILSVLLALSQVRVTELDFPSLENMGPLPESEEDEPPPANVIPLRRR